MSKVKVKAITRPKLELEAWRSASFSTSLDRGYFLVYVYDRGLRPGIADQDGDGRAGSCGTEDRWHHGMGGEGRCQ